MKRISILLFLSFLSICSIAQKNDEIEVTFQIPEKQISNRGFQYGLQAAPTKKVAVEDILFLDYVLLTKKGKIGFLKFDEKQDQLIPDGSEKNQTIINLGFFGVKPKPPASAPSLVSPESKESHQPFSNLFVDLIVNRVEDFVDFKSVKDLYLITVPVDKNPKIRNIGNKIKIKSKYLFVLWEPNKKADLPDLLKDAPKIKILQQSMPLSCIEPIKGFISSKIEEILVNNGFPTEKELGDEIYFDTKSRQLLIDKLSYMPKKDDNFLGLLSSSMLMVYKGDYLPDEWIGDLKKSDIPYIKTLIKRDDKKLRFRNILPLPPESDPTEGLTLPSGELEKKLKESVSSFMETNGFPTKNQRFKLYISKAEDKLLVANYDSEALRFSFLELTFVKPNLFVELKNQDGTPNPTQKVSHIELYNKLKPAIYGHSLIYNPTDREISFPSAYGDPAEITLDFDLKDVKPIVVGKPKHEGSNLVITYTCVSSKNEVKKEKKVKKDGPPVNFYYLDISELINKRTVQNFLNNEVKRIKDEKGIYYMYISNGSNPITANSTNDAYMNVLKKISTLNVDPPNAKSDKEKILAIFVKEGFDVQKNVHIHYFLSKITYNRSKEYIISNFLQGVDAQATIYVEELDKITIQEKYSIYKHVDINNITQ